MTDFYIKFNRKSPRRIRTVQPKKAIPNTNTSQFEKIKIDSNGVETVISKTIKIKEKEIQEWINQYNPGPFAILKRISEISLPHHNLLSKIIPELEDLVLKPYPPSDIKANEINSNNYFLSSSSSTSDTPSEFDMIFSSNPNLNFTSKAIHFYNFSNTHQLQNSSSSKESEQIDIQQYLNYDPYTKPYALLNSRQIKEQLTQILIESHDYQIDIMNKKEKIKELTKELEEKKKEKEKLEKTYQDYQYLLKNEEFGIYEVLTKEKEEREELLNHNKNEKNELKQQNEYSQIYGESRHIREDIQRLTKQLNESRKVQLSIAHDFAMKKYSEEEIENKYEYKEKDKDSEKNENNH